MWIVNKKGIDLGGLEVVVGLQLRMIGLKY